MFDTPVANVAPVKSVGLKCDHIHGVLTILGAAAAIRPSQFGDHNIFRRGDEDLSAKNLNVSSATKTLVIVRIIAEQKELDDKTDPTALQRLP